MWNQQKKPTMGMLLINERNLQHNLVMRGNNNSAFAPATRNFQKSMFNYNMNHLRGLGSCGSCGGR